jgi:hypothetical protein
MKRTLSFALVSLSLIVVMSCEKTARMTPENPPAKAEAAQPAAFEPKTDSARLLTRWNDPGEGFPDFGFMVTPQEYYAKYSDQPIFRLKADFPKTKPGELPEFMRRIDFRKNPKEYILAVRDYSFDGNLPD